MEQGLKERLVGASVLVILAVIFIPMLLGGSPETDQLITETNIPERPISKSGSRVVPLRVTQTDIANTNTDETRGKDVEPVDVQAEAQPPEITQEATDETEIHEKPADKQQSKRVGLKAWVVQLGSFNTRENAELLNEKLRKAGYPAFVEPHKQENGTIYHRVRVGPELLRSDAEALVARLKSSMNLNGEVREYPDP